MRQRVSAVTSGLLLLRAFSNVSRLFRDPPPFLPFLTPPPLSLSLSLSLSLFLYFVGMTGAGPAR